MSLPHKFVVEKKTMPEAKKKSKDAAAAAAQVAAPSSSSSSDQTEVPHLVKEGTDSSELSASDEELVRQITN